MPPEVVRPVECLWAYGTGESGLVAMVANAMPSQVVTSGEAGHAELHLTTEGSSPIVGPVTDVFNLCFKGLRIASSS